MLEEQLGGITIFTAAAINMIRLDAILDGKKAAKTWVSRFAALALVEQTSVV